MGSAKAPCPWATFTEEGFLVTDNEEVAPCFPLPYPSPAWEAPPQGYLSNRSPVQSVTAPQLPSLQTCLLQLVSAPRRGTPSKNGAGWQGWVSIQLWAWG